MCYFSQNCSWCTVYRVSITRICPRKKDSVATKQSSGVMVHEQKRLLLVNLKELHIDFVKATGIRIGFSTFCALRPKSYITVGSSGSHSVYVCEQHQNAKLLLTALPVHQDYKELLNLMVCSVDDRQCMLRECDKCPGKTQCTFRSFSCLLVCYKVPCCYFHHTVQSCFTL